MKSKARKIIEKWVKQTNRDRLPRYLGDGIVFMFPSRSAANRAHMVVWYRDDKQREYFACSCEAFFHNDEDHCPHIRDLRKQIAEAAYNEYGEA